MRTFRRVFAVVAAIAAVIGLVSGLVSLASPASATPPPQTFTWTNPPSSEYGTGLTSGQLDAVSNVAGSTVYKVTTGPGSTAGTTLTVGSILPAGAYTLTATFTPTDTTDYTTKTAVVPLTITPVELRGKANDASRAYGAANPTFTLSALTGFVNGDTAAVVSGSATFATTATATSPVGSYPITVDQGTLSAANYTFHLIPGDLEVGPITLTVTAGNGTQTYGAATPPTITPSYSGFVNGDTAASALTSNPTCSANVTNGTPVGTYNSSCIGGSATNYTLAYNTGTTTVTKATLTVTASNASQTYGDSTAPAITPNYSGFKNSQDASSLTTAPTCVANVTSTSAVGAYTSSCSGGSATNYTFSYVSGTVTVGAAVLTVTASDGAQTYGDAIAPTINPSYSGFLNGQNQSVLTAHATCSANVSQTTPAGTYASTCSGAAAPNYTINYVDGVVTVNKAPLTVTASGGSQQYGDIVPPAITPSYSGFLNGDDASAISLAPVCTSGVSPTTNAGVHTGASSCSGGSAANYTFNFVNGDVTVTKAVLSAKADDAARAYGAANPSFALSPFSGFLNGDTTADISGSAVLSTTATASSLPGAYPINAALGTLSATNYTFTLSPGVLTIGKIKEPVTVVGRAVNKLSVLFYGTLTAPDGTTVVLQNVNCSRLSDGTAITKTLAVGSYTVDGTSCTFIPIIADTYTSEGAVSGTFTASAQGITTVSLPDGGLSTPYKQFTKLAASGAGTPAWSVVGGSLPPGLSLASNGYLTGTPTTVGVYPFTVKLVLGTFTETWVYAISVPPVTVTSSGLPDGQIGVSYSQALTSNVAKTPAHWSLVGGALPDGLALSGAGVISGKPGHPGTFSFTVKVADSAVPPHSGTKTLTITVKPMTITTTSLKNGKVKSYYSLTLAASGGTTPRTWAVTGGALPAGLHLTSAGVIAGTPTAAGSSSFTVTATDHLGNTATAGFTLVVTS